MPDDPKPPITLAELDRQIAALEETRRRLEEIEADTRLRKAAIDREQEEKKRAVLEESKIHSLSSVVHSATMDEPMEALKDEIAGRRGARIEFPKRPMARASTNSGLSIFAIAAQLKVPYSTVKSWGVKSLPPDDKRKILAAKPFLVPESAWKL